MWPIGVARLQQRESRTLLCARIEGTGPGRNRLFEGLLKPALARYGGHILSADDHSVLALFRHPSQAIRLAATLQRGLARVRERHPRHALSIRVGLHIGQAQQPADSARAAALVQSCAADNEILLSDAALDHLGWLAALGCIQRVDRIMTLGRKHALTLYRLDWLKPIPAPAEPVDDIPRLQDKHSLVLHSLGALAVLSWLHLRFGRYFWLGSERFAVAALNPMTLLARPWVLAALALILVVLLWRLWTVAKPPVRTLKLVRGVLGFGLGMMIAQLLIAIWPAVWTPDSHWLAPLYTSAQQIVEVRANRAVIRREPELTAPALQRARAGTLLPLAVIVQRDDLSWHQVLLGPDRYGWILQVMPAHSGRPATRISLADHAYLRWIDLYAFCAGLVGLWWGLTGFALPALSPLSRTAIRPG